MMPKPVDLRARHFPLNRDPSKYQVADSMAAVCGGGVCQVKQPSSCDGGAGTRKTRSPLLRKMYRLIPESRDSNSSAPLGGLAHPPALHQTHSRHRSCGKRVNARASTKDSSDIAHAKKTNVRLRRKSEWPIQQQCDTVNSSATRSTAV